MDKSLSKTLPGLADFYTVGRWAGGIGLPNVAAICKQDGWRLVTLTY